MSDLQDAPPIARGFAYPALRVRATGAGAIFPDGVALRADVRIYPGAPTAAATLSTEAGTIVRVDDERIDFRIPAEATAKLSNSTAVIDFVRTDVEPEEWIGLQLVLPVIDPATAPA